MNDITIYNYNPWKIEEAYLPLGQLYLVSALEKNGYNVDFRDFQFLKYPKSEEVFSFFKNSSDIIALGCMSHALPSLLLLTREIKKKYPEKTIILGGIGSTGVSEEIFETSPVDIVVKGEGDKSIVEVMDCLEKNKDLKNVRGICYREGNKIKINPPRPRIENLDQLPFPAFDKININNYEKVHVVTSRGCPYWCTFCYCSFFWENRVMFRSIENVIEEIKLMFERYNGNRLNIYDDVFPLDKKRIFEFCDRLKKEKMDINWRCCGRINLMNEQLMKKMSESGCDAIFYGVESGSDKILKKVNKGFSVKMAKDVLTKSKKYFTGIDASFLWGFPFETIEDFKKTIKLVEDFTFKLDINAGLNCLRPEIGSQIYNNYKDHLIPFFQYHKSRIILNYSQITRLVRDTRLMCKDADIFEVFKKYPNILLFYYVFKTPNFSQKINIYEKFIKKTQFYAKSPSVH